MFAPKAQAASVWQRTEEEKTQKGIEIEEITVSELEDIYKKLGYENYIHQAQYSGKVPAVFLKKFPSDFKNIADDEDRRNQLFIKIVAPLGIKVNNEILAEREELERIAANFEKNGKLTPEEEQRVEEFAKKYDHFTRLKGNARYKLLLAELRTKIDIIPVSFYVAMAAAETNWGTSRIVEEARSLYKELVWYTDDGLKPADEKEDDSYRIKIFPSLYDAIRSLALKLNSNINYSGMRGQRKEHRYRRQLMSGRGMAHTLPLHTPLKNYVGLIDYTTTFYEMVYLDSAHFSYPKLPVSETPKKEEKEKL